MASLSHVKSCLFPVPSTTKSKLNPVNLISSFSKNMLFTSNPDFLPGAFNFAVFNFIFLNSVFNLTTVTDHCYC